MSEYRVTFPLGSMGEPSLAYADLTTLLLSLVATDAMYLLAHPEVPRLADAGITVVAPSPSPSGAPWSTEDYKDVPTMLLRDKRTGLRTATNPSLVAWAAAEALVRDKIPQKHVRAGIELDPKSRTYQAGVETMGRPAYAPGVPTPYSPWHRVTFVTGLFDGDKERDLSHRTLEVLLAALLKIDMTYLRAHPETPDLYSSGVYYQEEPPGQEDWQDVWTCLRMKSADCVPSDTLVLREDYTFARIADLEAGDRIMGDGEATTVRAVAFTGAKTVLAFELDNGCVLRCTPEHRVFLADGTEVRAESVRVGQDLKALTKPLPPHEPVRFDERIPDEDLAWLLGVYIADGWHNPYNTFCISGDDANPKRGKIEQKERVRAICEAANIDTRWAKKSIAVSDKRLRIVMGAAGGLAPHKRVPDMRLSLPQAKAMLEGLRTDASLANSGTWTHGTVSPILVFQLRVLYRMLDQTVHIRRWDEHGGLGKNPIYRVTVRKDNSEAERLEWRTRNERVRTSARVRSIREEDEPVECVDIETDSGRFYLPECDLVVHNCEDLAAWRAAELNVRLGIRAVPKFIFEKRKDGSYLYHIQVQLPDGRIEDPSRVLGMR